MAEVALNARQQRAAVLLASGSTSGSVAQELKIHRATLVKWQNRPEFGVFVNQLKEEGRAAARAKLIGLAEKAVTTLEKLLDSENERIRLAAVSEILRHFSAVPISAPIDPSTVQLQVVYEDKMANRSEGDD